MFAVKLRDYCSTDEKNRLATLLAFYRSLVCDSLSITTSHATIIHIADTSTVW